MSPHLCTLQLLQRALIYFNKAAAISRDGRDNVCRGDPAAAIDLAPSSAGQLRPLEEGARGQAPDSAGLLAPCIDNHPN